MSATARLLSGITKWLPNEGISTSKCKSLRNSRYFHQYTKNENCKQDFRKTLSELTTASKMCSLFNSSNNYLPGFSTCLPAKTLVLRSSTTYFFETKRFYAKGRDKVKNKNTKVVVNEEEIGQLIDVADLKTRLEDLLKEMKEEFATSLNIRGASGHLETLQVEFEGETYALQELAQVGRKNPQLAVLNLSSLPQACEAVMLAIQNSGMNVNPQQEGTTIYVPLPKVTREHRENLAKSAKSLFTKYKVLLQSVQNAFIKDVKKQTGMSEDLVFNVQHQIMKMTDGYINEADKLTTAKQKELLDTK